jgi:hypothetical protein
LLPGVRNWGTRSAIRELTIQHVNIVRGSAADVWVIGWCEFLGARLYPNEIRAGFDW